MGAIFLSYAREDRDCAEKLALVLEEAGHDVWWDRRLGGGEEFSAEIEAALDKSDVVLVAWSKESVRSRWVRDEAAVGGESGKLLPVSIDGSLAPMGFRQYHTLDLSHWKSAKRDKRTAELLKSVEHRLQARGSAPAPVPRVVKDERRLVLPTVGRSWLVGAVLLLLVAVAAGVFFEKSRQGPDQPVKPTMALLPFTMASPDPELLTLASQARDSLAHTFVQSGMPLKLLSAAPQDGRPAADFVMSGDLSRNGDKIVATIRLDEAAHGVAVYSRRIEASHGDVRDFPERIGVQIAANLTNTTTMLMLDRRHPLDPGLIADLMGGDDYGADQLQAYQQAKRAAAKAPNVSVAQVALAYNTAFSLSALPREERGAALTEGRQAADRGIALGPRIGDAYATWCVLHSDVLIAECEDRLRAAKRIDPDAPWLNTFLSHLLRGVGRFDEATQLARLSQTHDIYLPQKIMWLLRSLEYNGEHDEAQQLYQQGIRWWPDFKPLLFRNRVFGLMDRGDFEAIQQLEQSENAAKLWPGYVDSRALAAALKSKSPAAARQACPATAGFLMKLRCMLVLAMVGDENGAYALADELYPRRVGRTPAETERIWLDEPDSAGDPEFITSRAAAAMRRDPRYIALVERIGLLAYWRSGRSPDFCRKSPEPICAQLLKRAN